MNERRPTLLTRKCSVGPLGMRASLYGQKKNKSQNPVTFIQLNATVGLILMLKS